MNVIDHNPSRLCKKAAARAMPVVQHFLTPAFVENACREAGHCWRERCWPPVLTLLACIYKQLTGVSSRKIEDWAAALTGAPSGCSRDGLSFCLARLRLPLEVFARAMWHLGTQASNAGAWVWHGRRVLIFDGTTMRAPRTARNVKAFGQSDNGRKKSHFPLVRMVALVCAGAGAVLDIALGDYASSEMRLIRGLIERLQEGALLVLDGGFSSFMLLWLAGQRHCDVLARHHHTRRGEVLEKLGEGDELHLWKRPKKPRVAWTDLLPQTPRSLVVRVIRCHVERKGYRTLVLKLVTTLLDPNEYPAHELVALYLQRWNIEVDFRTLKSEYGMARLTGQSENSVLKEIYSTLLAYNAVQLLLARSGPPVRTLSPTRARALICEFCASMSTAPTIQLPALFKQLLHLLSTATLDYQQRPPQPRKIVSRQSTYSELTTTRQEWLRDHYAA